MRKQRIQAARIVIALVMMVVGFLGVCPKASAENVQELNGVQYTEDEQGNVTVVGYTGSEPDLNLEYLLTDEEGNTKNVIKIADEALKGNKTITYLKIPDTCTEIGASAFQGCTKLEYVGPTVLTGPTTLTIGASAFEGCSALGSILLERSCDLSIGDRAFYGCTYLHNADIGFILPNGTSSIGSYAFYNCGNLLSEITIPNTVISIGDDAFYGCSGIENVNISKNAKLMSIGDRAFKGTNLDNEYSWGTEVNHGITIPASCTSIGEEAFALAEGNLNYVNLYADVTIGKNAFGEEDETRENASDIILYGESTYTNAIKYAKDAGEAVKYQVNSKSLEVKPENVKRVYTYKPTEEIIIDPNGLEVTATYKETDEQGKDITGTADVTDCVISEIEQHKIGPQTITVSYGGVKATYEIYVCYDMADLELSVAAPDSYVYTGNEKTPKILITRNETELDDKDSLGDNMIVPSNVVPYSLAYENNINAYEGELKAAVSETIPTVIVTGDNKYITGTKNLYFNIAKANLADNKDVTVQLASDSVEYSGEEQKPKYTLYFKGEVISDTDHYTAEYTDNIHVGTAYITITADDNAINFKGSKSGCSFQITPYPLNEKMVAIENQKYTGIAGEPTGITVTHAAATQNITLKNGIDYMVVKDSYSQNTEVGNHTVRIEGKGDYSGTVEASYRIEPVDLRDESIITVEVSTEKEYTGKTLKPDVKVTQKAANKDITLKEDTHYTVSVVAKDETGESEDAPKNIAAYKVTIAGKGNYIGEIEKEYKITSIDVRKATISDVEESYAFTGKEICPNMTVAIGDTALHEGTDYEVVYENNVEPGKATFTITGKGIYSGTLEGSFTVLGRPLFVEDAEDNAVIADIENQIYSGEEITPEVVVTKNDNTLKKNEDYTVAYSKNISAGTATVTITGIDQYSGTMEKTFEIIPFDVKDCDVKLASAEEIYTGSEIMPAVTVNRKAANDKYVALEKTDYTVSCENNVNVGTATVTITGKGNYTGTISKSFTIVAFDLKDCSVKLVNTEEVYTGSEITPAVAVMRKAADDKQVVLKDTDYTVTYKNNVDVGTADIVITGKGNYTGTISKNFTIAAFDLKDCNVKLASTEAAYTGSAITPAVEATHKKDEKNVYQLVKDTDYTVTYKNNINAGTAAVTVAGKGNYTGTVDLQFTINAPAPTPTPSPTPSPAPSPAPQTPVSTEKAVGTVVTVGNAQYKITGTAENTAGTVSFVKSTKDKKKLTSLTIPNTVKIDGKTYNVTAIEKNACKNYSKLKKLTIGKNVKSIGASAFAGCKALKSIKIQSTLLTKKTIGKKAFSGIHKKAVIKVPKKKVKEYKKALYGCGVSKTVKIK
ncbi:MAG: leucine-rich repeat protein [Clostridiales bacterium]|nr:leucine-rich repeat protein [Clostridiales bacterium]